MKSSRWSPALSRVCAARPVVVCFVTALAAGCGSDAAENGPADVLDISGEFDAGADATLDATIRPDVAADTAPDAPPVDAAPDAVPADTSVDTETPDTAPDAAPDTTPDAGPPARCGDGILSGRELCDGERFPPGIDCSTFSFLGGELACNDDCTYDTSACYDALCGDGVLTGDEACEAGDTATCADLGFAPGGDEGTFACSDTCTYDTSTCQLAICGNAVVEDGEDCDGTLEDTCETLGFAPGGEGVAVCDACAVDTSACEVSICGNGVTEAEFETCDGADVGGETCRSLGFFAGDVVCNAGCDAIDTAACVPNVCGSGTIEGDEVCEPGFVTLTCADLTEAEGGPFVGGAIACAADCFALDTSGCLTDLTGIDDTDEDGVPDSADNCPEVANARQLDVDGDGTGNVCDEPERFTVLVEREAGNTLSVGIAGDLPIALGDVTFEVSTAELVLTFDDDGGVDYGFSIGLAETALPLDLGGGGFPIPLPVALEIVFENGQLASTADVTLETTLEQIAGGAFDLAVPTMSVNGAVSADTGLLGAVELTASEAALSVSMLRWDALTDSVVFRIDDPTFSLGEGSIGLPPLLAFTFGLTGVVGELEVTLPAP